MKKENSWWTIVKDKIKASNWWLNATANLFGTMLGIILTVGVTMWQQKAEEKEMVRKTTKITLNNIDVRLENLESAIAEFEAKDSIYHHLLSYMPDRFDQVDSDSLLQDLNVLVYRHFFLTDTKSEDIFSHSFEVWKYLDEQTIGRISICYSVLDHNEQMLEKLRERVYAISYQYMIDDMEKQIRWSTPEMIQQFVSDPEVVILFDEIHNFLPLLKGSTNVAQQMNDRNKEVLGLSEEELEVGDLLEDMDSYEISTETNDN